MTSKGSKLCSYMQLLRDMENPELVPGESVRHAVLRPLKRGVPNNRWPSPNQSRTEDKVVLC